VRVFGSAKIGQKQLVAKKRWKIFPREGGGFQHFPGECGWGGRGEAEGVGEKNGGLTTSRACDADAGPPSPL
jgi:hypothetical protein